MFMLSEEQLQELWPLRKNFFPDYESFKQNYIDYAPIYDEIERERKKYKKKRKAK